MLSQSFDTHIREKTKPQEQCHIERDVWHLMCYCTTDIVDLMIPVKATLTHHCRHYFTISNKLTKKQRKIIYHIHENEK